MNEKNFLSSNENDNTSTQQYTGLSRRGLDSSGSAALDNKLNGPLGDSIPFIKSNVSHYKKTGIDMSQTSSGKDPKSNYIPIINMFPVEKQLFPSRFNPSYVECDMKSKYLRTNHLMDSKEKVFQEISDSHLLTRRSSNSYLSQNTLGDKLERYSKDCIKDNQKENYTSMHNFNDIPGNTTLLENKPVDSSIAELSIDDNLPIVDDCQFNSNQQSKINRYLLNDNDNNNGIKKNLNFQSFETMHLDCEPSTDLNFCCSSEIKNQEMVVKTLSKDVKLNLNRISSHESQDSIPLNLRFNDITSKLFSNNLNRNGNKEFNQSNTYKYLNETNSGNYSHMTSMTDDVSLLGVDKVSMKEYDSYSLQEKLNEKNFSNYNNISPSLNDNEISLKSIGDESLEQGPQVITRTEQNSQYSSKSMEKNVRLVSSYVEEIRLKYFPTSNSLHAPPDLPITLKTKNILEQAQSIKVTIRTNSKQIGIKHGKAKQKLLTLETAHEENENSDNIFSDSMKFDHIDKYNHLIDKNELLDQNRSIPDDIVGDDAYNIGDAMAPLREYNEDSTIMDTNTYNNNGRVKRSDTVTSYFTKTANRLRSGTLDAGYNYISQIQNDLSLTNYASNYSDYKNDNMGDETYDEISMSDYEFHQPRHAVELHIANPDSASD